MKRTSIFLLGLSLFACEKQSSQAPSPSTPGDETPTEQAEATVQPIPEGYSPLTPMLTIKDLDKAILFYSQALGAKKLSSMPDASGKTMHAELQIGESIIMLGEENLEQHMPSPLALGGTPGSLLVYVADVDTAVKQATEAGATVLMPPTDMFWGDRFASLQDPFGHRWDLATHTEELSEEQMGARVEAFNQNPQSNAWQEIKGEEASDFKPAQYHTVTPALIVRDASAVIEFYSQAFGAKEVTRALWPDGRVMHAEVLIHGDRLMISDEMPEHGARAPQTLGGSPFALHMYVDEVDVQFKQAVDANGQALLPVQDMFWGDRYGAILDPEGFMWGIATHVQDRTPEEMMEAMQKSTSAETGQHE